MDKRPDDPRAETSRAEIAVEIIAVNKWYGDFHVLRDIDLDGRARRAHRHLRPVRLAASRR